MKKLVIAIAVAGTALLGSSVANAAENGVKSVNGVAKNATDFSAKKKHHRRGHHKMHNSRNHYNSRHWSRGYHSRYNRSYGYAPGPYYGDRGYDRPYGGPSVTFGFGSSRW